MQVPFLDLKAQHAALEAELTEAFRAIVRGAAFVGGPEVEAFEREFAAFCHADGAVGVGSGTDALRFAYLAMGIKPGDEVITVPNSFIATTEALTQAGATVRFVDVLPETLLMDPTHLAVSITPRTVGIVPVHLNDPDRSEEHTSELQSLTNLVCRLLLEKKNRVETRNSLARRSRSARHGPRHGSSDCQSSSN